MVKFFKRLIIGLVVFYALLYLTGNWFIVTAFMNTYMIGNTTANINDKDAFESRTIDNGVAQPWNISSLYGTKKIPEKHVRDFEEMNSAAYLLIKDDSIIHEEYWDNYSATSQTNSFSMAKSVVAALIGTAIQDGKIKNVNQPVGDFIPSYKEGDKSKITIEHVLTMSSGLSFEENYHNPFAYSAEAYYGDEVTELTLSHDVVEEPGRKFNYLSGNTQLLGMIVAKAYGITLSEATSEKLWKPLGASQPAYWSLDHKDGVEKAFCCIHSNARDYARMGKLYLDSGKANGVQLIPKEYIKASITPANVEFETDELTRYGYQWWLMPNYKGYDIFMMKGHMGQHVICIPEERIIIVRLGDKKEHVGPNKSHSIETKRYIDVALEMLGLE